jgi:hypothetical protein
MHIARLWLCPNTNTKTTSIAVQISIPEFSTSDNFIIFETVVNCLEIFNRRFQIYNCMLISLITGILKELIRHDQHIAITAATPIPLRRHQIYIKKPNNKGRSSYVLLILSEFRLLTRLTYNCISEIYD